MSGHVVYRPAEPTGVHVCDPPLIHTWPVGTVWQCDDCGEHYEWFAQRNAAVPWWWRVDYGNNGKPDYGSS